MEAKVIKIDIDGNDLECADELEKIIVEAITEAITQSIELKHKQENLAEKAWASFISLMACVIISLHKSLPIRSFICLLS